VEPEAAAQARDLFDAPVRFGGRVAGDDAAEAFGRDGAADFLVHLDEDEAAAAAVLFVQLQDGVAGRAAAGEGVEDDGVLVGGELKDALDQTCGLRSDE
jgi:hypothetical protein